MTNRLFCEHCDKFYEVDIKDIHFMKEKKGASMHFKHNTYFYTDGCFFQKLKKIKQRFLEP